MNIGYIKFCRKYKDKQENDEKLRLEKDPNGFVLKINFQVGYTESAENLMHLGTFTQYPTILDLDQEDIDYLYDKYSKRLQEEKKARIADIEKEYKL